MNEREKKRLIELLGKVDRKKPIGSKLFNALAKVTVSVAIEAVCLRWNAEDKKVEVYLTKRSPKETAYPGLWHCPGSVLRPGESIENVFARLMVEEFKTLILSVARPVADINHPTEPRGHFFSVVYLCVLVDTNKKLEGKWFPVDKLPKKIIKIQKRKIIPAAVGVFVANNIFD